MSDEIDQKTFEQMGLDIRVLQAITKMGYVKPTPIQATAIPHLKAGRDVIGQAQTGTGKTAAFSLPLLSTVDVSQVVPQLLVLAPTRELASQVCDAMKAYSRGIDGLRLLAVYGGQGMGDQLRALHRGVHIVVGTPGRLLDHLNRGTLVLDQLRAVVLDEADEMLRMGFIDDVEAILAHMPEERQTVLFSATMPPPIAKIAKRYLNEPIEIRTKRAATTVDAIHQCYVPVSGELKKFEALTRLLEFEDYDGMIVFARTRISTVEIAERLEARGYRASALNGDMNQPLRQRTVERFKKGGFDILVCTDVAARGLDVPRISHVVNFDIPFDTEAYVHRIGRTGRAGRNGKAILFAGRSQKRRLLAIEKATGKSIERISLPSAADIRGRRIEQFKAFLTQTIESHELYQYQSVITDYAEESGCGLETAAAALAYLVQRERPFIVRDVQLEDQERRRSERGRKRDRKSDNVPRRSRREHDTHHDDEAAGTGEAPQQSDESTRNKPSQRRRANMSVYRVEVGSSHGLEPKHLVGAISNEIDLPSKHIGSIRIASSYSVVELPAGMPKEVLAHLRNVWVCGAKLRMSHIGDDSPAGQRKSKKGRQQPEAGKNRRRRKRSSDNASKSTKKTKNSKKSPAKGEWKKRSKRAPKS